MGNRYDDRERGTEIREEQEKNEVLLARSRAYIADWINRRAG